MIRSRAACVPFYRYTPHTGDYYKLYWDFFLWHLPKWAQYIDKLYIIDQEWGFTSDDLNRLQNIIPGGRILKSPVSGHHWEQFKWAIPQMKEEHILFMDNDVIIFDGAVSVDQWFLYAERDNKTIVTAFDGSGNMQQQIHQKFPLLKDMGMTRMGSYYFVLPQTVFQDVPDFEFAPIYYGDGVYIPELDYTTKKDDFFDSFGLFTLKWLQKGYKPIIIPDFRDSIYYDEQGSVEDPPHTRYNGGRPYYHIRNGNMMNYVLTSKKYHKYRADYERVLRDVPRRELVRELCWWRWMEEKAYPKTAYGHNGLNTLPELAEILRDVGISGYEFAEHWRKFLNYHSI